MNRFTYLSIATAISLMASSAFTQENPLATKSGNNIGLTASNYEYTESGVSNKATKRAIDYAGTYAKGNQWFLRGEARYADGKSDYEGSGIKTDNPDWYYEVRALLGRDVPFRDQILSPYIGLGYRYLYNDVRGLTSTGYVGYRRESNYYTLPVGVNHRMNLRNNAQLFTTLQFDYLIYGQQDTRLSDIVGYNG